MSGDMGQRGIKVTGISEIDGATSEIAGHIRDGRVGSHGGWTEQDHYDDAAHLRDRIMAGERTRIVRQIRALAAEDPAWRTDRFAAQALADLIEQDGLPIPAHVTPMVITDDIALNMAAHVLQAMGRPATADMLRRMLPAAEGRVNAEPYQEPTGKWGPIAREAS